MRWRYPLVAVAALCCACAPPSSTAPTSTAPTSPLETTVAEVDWFVESPIPAVVQRSGAQGEFRMHEVMGGGVGLFDADGDGRLDLYLAGDAPGRLLLQQPDGRFVESTAQTGAADAGHAMGVAAADVDNDGDIDLYLTRQGPDRLLLNDGGGRFVPGRLPPDEGWSTSAAFCDYDLDGLLDLFVARYVEIDGDRRCTDAAGRIEYCTPRDFEPTTDLLLRNLGDGHFADVTTESGIGDAAGAGLGVVCADFDRDGRPDFYVANDLDPNRLWLQTAPGRFRDEALLQGVAFNLEGAAESGMGLVAEDLDGDLELDLLVTHLEAQTHTLYSARPRAGRGYFDVTADSGLAGPSLPMTGFGIVAADLDLDGDLDLAMANGRVFRRAAATVTRDWSAYAERNQLFRADGRATFGEVRGGDFTSRLEASRGLASGDVDRDGDVDLLLGSLDAPLRLYLGQAAGRSDWLIVRPLDVARRRVAEGAEVTLQVGEAMPMLRLVSSAGSYLSSREPLAHFGLPPGELRYARVRWPGGTVEQFALGETNRNSRLDLRRGEGERVP